MPSFLPASLACQVFWEEKLCVIIVAVILLLNAWQHPRWRKEEGGEEHSLWWCYCIMPSCMYAFLFCVLWHGWPLQPVEVIQHLQPWWCVPPFLPPRGRNAQQPDLFILEEEEESACNMPGGDGREEGGNAACCVCCHHAYPGNMYYDGRGRKWLKLANWYACLPSTLEGKEEGEEEMHMIDDDDMPWPF